MCPHKNSEKIPMVFCCIAASLKFSTNAQNFALSRPAINSLQRNHKGYVSKHIDV